MKKIVSTFLICVSLATVSKAQDPNFSQFFASPLTLNPALTGKFDGDFRIAGNYRNQWPTINNAFVTKTVSLDFGIMKNRISELDQMGVGILGVTDRAGDGVLTTNYAGLSLAYHKGLDEDGFHQVGAGFQGIYINKRLDVTKVQFADQLTPLGFTGVTSEIFNHYNELQLLQKNEFNKINKELLQFLINFHPINQNRTFGMPGFDNKVEIARSPARRR